MRPDIIAKLPGTTRQVTTRPPAITPMRHTGITSTLHITPVKRLNSTPSTTGTRRKLREHRAVAALAFKEVENPNERVRHARFG